MSPQLRTYRRLVGLLLLGLVPTAVFGIALEPFFENLFDSVRAVGIALLLTGIVLFFISRQGPGRRDLESMSGLDALIVGIAQGCAIVPGLSRSGMTISSALARGLNRDAATRFSFLISIPTIAGAALFELDDILSFGAGQDGILLLVGFVVAALAGIVAIKLLVSLLQRGKLQWFAYYVWILGALVIWRSWGV